MVSFGVRLPRFRAVTCQLSKPIRQMTLTGRPSGKSSSGEVTRLLRAWREGENSALDRLIPLVHTELRRIAHRYMRKERAGHTLQTSALVNEAYLRLVGAQEIAWQNRAHFLAISSNLMRRILVDLAREKHARKRGGDNGPIALDEEMFAGSRRSPDLIALDDALSELAKVDQRKCRVIEMRFFGGLSEAEMAEALEVSPETVRRDWRLAKAWLFRFLSEDCNQNS